MKKVIISFIILACLYCQAKQITVPEDTEVLISVDKITDSKKIPKSYEIKSSVAVNLTLNNVNIARIDNPAVIKVSDFHKAKSFGRGGYITINGAVFYDNSGNPHNLHIKETIYGNNDIWLTRIIPFNKGKQAIITPSYIFKCKTIAPFDFDPSAPTANFAMDKKGKKVKVQEPIQIINTINNNVYNK